jgi:hypothetical protein
MKLSGRKKASEWKARRRKMGQLRILLHVHRQTKSAFHANQSAKQRLLALFAADTAVEARLLVMILSGAPLFAS